MARRRTWLEKLDPRERRRLKADMDWLMENYAQIAPRHRNQWIAIGDKKVIGWGTLTRADRMAERAVPGRPFNTIFIDDGSQIWRGRAALWIPRRGG